MPMTATAARFARFSPLAGAASAALTIAAYLKIGPNPDSSAATSTDVAYYAGHHGDASVAGLLLMYAAVLFAVFGVTVWARMRERGIHPILVGSMLVATAVTTMSDLVNASGWYLLGDLGGKDTISPATIQALHISVAAADAPAAAGLGVFLAVFAASGILGRTFPGWLAWPALALGILELVPTPGAVGFFAGLAILPWMVAAAIGLYRRPAADRAAVGGGSPAAAARPA